MTNVTAQLSRDLRSASLRVRHGVALAWGRVRRSQAGEGVISAAIAVLVMAFLGAAMWFAFNNTMNHAQHNVDNQVGSIGSNSPGSPATGVGGTTGSSIP